MMSVSAETVVDVSAKPTTGATANIAATKIAANLKRFFISHSSK